MPLLFRCGTEGPRTLIARLIPVAQQSVANYVLEMFIRLRESELDIRTWRLDPASSATNTTGKGVGSCLMWCGNYAKS